MMVSVLAAVLKFQRDMISENPREGVTAAEADGKTLGRPAALDQNKAATIVEAYRQGAAVKALARQHQVAPKTIRRVLETPPVPALCPTNSRSLRSAPASGPVRLRRT
ncbi:hypothetical protein GCM10022419_105470 [Nonomuraea rosea]|uniref:Resolvase/invertase-type recombinase catalytic domain-containing protein n=1 Tax=Nonomuraea rosea TaxID=638574 RepID=A0ABP6ZBD6_9ACTN